MVIWSTERPRVPGIYLALSQGGRVEQIAVALCLVQHEFRLQAVSGYGQHDPLLWFKAFRKMDWEREAWPAAKR